MIQTYLLKDGRSLESRHLPFQTQREVEALTKSGRRIKEIHTAYHYQLTPDVSIEVTPVKGLDGFWSETGLKTYPPRWGDMVVTSIGKTFTVNGDSLMSEARQGVYCVTTEFGEMWVKRLSPHAPVWTHAD